MRMLAKLTWVELKLFVREPLTVVFSLAFPLILFLVLAEVFGNEADPEVYRGVGAIDFYVPAYIGLVIASVGIIGIPVHLAAYREAGVLRRFRASSIPVWSVFGSQIIVSYAIAIASGALVILIAVLLYDMSAPQFAGGVIAAFVLGTLSFAALGFLLGAVLPTPRVAQLAGLMLFFVMMLLSGPGPPREVLGDVLQRVGDVLPLTHIVVLMQDPWLGFGWNLGEMLVSLGILAGSALLAVRFFRWE
ncbi:MAG: ABC transporter permease [Chloroflexi bacterium]|nr:ABC transporter permease [Chloroflexota bacterium]